MIIARALAVVVAASLAVTATSGTTAQSIDCNIGGWISQLRDGTLFGMSHQHLFNDATAVALLGIALYVDAFWHARHL